MLITVVRREVLEMKLTKVAVLEVVPSRNVHWSHRTLVVGYRVRMLAQKKGVDFPCPVSGTMVSKSPEMIPPRGEYMVISTG